MISPTNFNQNTSSETQFSPVHDLNQTASEHMLLDHTNVTAVNPTHSPLSVDEDTRSGVVVIAYLKDDCVSLDLGPLENLILQLLCQQIYHRKALSQTRVCTQVLPMIQTLWQPMQ